MSNLKDENLKILSKLPVKRIQTILEVLMDLRRRFNNGEDVPTPLTTIYLKSGRSFSGWLLDMAKDRKEQCLLFQIYYENRMAIDYDVVYFHPHSIDTIVIHNIPKMAHLFSFGKIAAPQKPAPSKLELRRKSKEYARTVSGAIGVKIGYDADWKAMPRGEEVMRSLADLLSDVTGALVEIAKDKFSKEEIAKVLKKVFFGAAEEAEVSLEGDTLKIASILPSPPDKKLSRKDLREAIEKAF